MEYVQFFHRKWPVIGEAKPLPFPDGECKFWTCVAGDKYANGFRTHRGDDGEWRSLQERLDNFINKESFGGTGLSLCFVTHIRPSNDAEIRHWLDGHKWLYDYKEE